MKYIFLLFCLDVRIARGWIVDKPLLSPKRLYHAFMWYWFYVDAWYPKAPKYGLWWHMRWYRRKEKRWRIKGY